METSTWAIFCVDQMEDTRLSELRLRNLQDVLKVHSIAI